MNDLDTATVRRPQIPCQPVRAFPFRTTGVGSWHDGQRGKEWAATTIRRYFAGRLATLALPTAFAGITAAGFFDAGAFLAGVFFGGLPVATALALGEEAVFPDARFLAGLVTGTVFFVLAVFVRGLFAALASVGSGNGFGTQAS